MKGYNQQATLGSAITRLCLSCDLDLHTWREKFHRQIRLRYVEFKSKAQASHPTWLEWSTWKSFPRKNVNSKVCRPWQSWRISSNARRAIGALRSLDRLSVPVDCLYTAAFCWYRPWQRCQVRWMGRLCSGPSVRIQLKLRLLWVLRETFH